MRKVIMLTNYKNIIPQRKNEIEGLQLEIISKVLNENGFVIEIMTINSFILSLNKNKNIEGAYFYYTSSQYPIYKSFIQDVLIQIKLRGGILIPEFRHFLAHENKSFQELEKVRIDIKSPYSKPVGTYEEGIEALNKLSYPIVIKKSTGFRSRNVKLAHNKEEGKKILFRMLESNFKFDFDSLYYLYRRTKNKKHYPKRFGKIIIQEYVPNLTHDWKILVLGNICFSLKRIVRKNDFRASGSKKFSILDDPSSELLDFALSCKEKIKCPNISLDIFENRGDLQLIEYQTMHFGLLTAMIADSYFVLVNGSWEKRKITDEIEHYFGIGICEYIKNIEASQ